MNKSHKPASTPAPKSSKKAITPIVTAFPVKRKVNPPMKTKKK